MEWKALFFIVLTMFFVSFALQNPGNVSVTFLKWHSPDMPLVYLLVFSLVGGMILSSLLAIAKKLRLHNEINRLKRRIKSQDEELKRLRTLSLVSSPSELDNPSPQTEDPPS